jgi:hypothetical protein
MNVFFLAVALALPAHAAKPDPFAACRGAKGIATAKLIEKRDGLAAQRESLEAEVKSAAPVHCGKGLPMPAVHGKVQEYSRAMHSLAVKLRAAAGAKGIKAECKKQLESYMTASEADQRALYQRVEALCR